MANELPVNPAGNGGVVAAAGGSAVEVSAEAERKSDIAIANAFLWLLFGSIVFVLLAAISVPIDTLVIRVFSDAPQAAADAAGASQTVSLNSALSQVQSRQGWVMSNLVRGAEVLSTLAAAVLVFLIIQTRKSESLLTILGIVVIASIIMPSRDIIRLATIFSRNGEEPREATGRGGALTSPDYDNSVVTATRLIAELNQNGYEIVPMRRRGSTDSATPRPAEEVSAVRSTPDLFLGERLFFLEVGGLSASVRQRGLDRVLREIFDPNALQNIVLSQSMNTRFREDVEALRDLGVVSMLYSSMSHLQVTNLGIHVLNRLEPTNREILRAAEERRITLVSPRDRPGTVAAAAAPRREQQVAQTLLAQSRSIAFMDTAGAVPLRVVIAGGAGAGLRFSVTGQETEVVIEARGIDRFDPTLAVFPINGTVVGERLEFSDDWGGTNDARIMRRFPVGDYLIMVSGFFSGAGGGEVNVALRTATPEDRQARRWTVESANLLRGARAAAAQPVELERESVLSFDVAQPAFYTIRAEAVDSADPKIELYRVSDRLALWLAEDDDGGGGLSAQLQRNLEPGRYAVRLFFLTPGKARVSVAAGGATPAAAEPEPAAATGAGPASSTPPPDPAPAPEPPAPAPR